MKNKFKETLLLGASIIVSLAFLEFGIRVFVPIASTSGKLELVDYDGIVTGKRNSDQVQYNKAGEYNVRVVFNKYGFRDKKDLLNSKTTDWFLLGDSFGIGHGVEGNDKFSYVAQRAAQKTIYNISVASLDFEGYGTILDYVKGLGVTVNKIIIAVYMGNDLRDYSVKSKKKVGIKVKFKNMLNNHLALYRLVVMKIKSHPSTNRIAERLGFNNTYQGHREYDQGVINESAKKLEELTGGKKAIVMLIPHVGLWKGGNEEEERKIHVGFADRLIKNGIKIVDLLTYFEDVGMPLRYYYKEDGHWNKQGHFMAGKHLAQVLEQVE